MMMEAMGMAISQQGIKERGRKVTHDNQLNDDNTAYDDEAACDDDKHNDNATYNNGHKRRCNWADASRTRATMPERQRQRCQPNDACATTIKT